MKTAILDIDGTLCPSVFANIRHNDNSLLCTPEFEERLRTVQAFPWVVKHDWAQYRYIIVITGRLQKWRDLTYTWLQEHGIEIFSFDIHEIEWDDSLPTREDSYNDYARRKVLRISREIATRLAGSKNARVTVYEDDKNVLYHVNEMWSDWNVSCILIDKHGKQVIL